MDVPSATVSSAPNLPAAAAQTSQEPSPGLKKSQLLLLLLIVAAGGWLRFHRIATPSLWMDELWSIEMSAGQGSAHDHLPANVI